MCIILHKLPNICFFGNIGIFVSIHIPLYRFLFSFFVFFFPLVSFLWHKRRLNCEINLLPITLPMFIKDRKIILRQSSKSGVFVWLRNLPGLKNRAGLLILLYYLILSNLISSNLILAQYCKVGRLCGASHTCSDCFHIGAYGKLAAHSAVQIVSFYLQLFHHSCSKCNDWYSSDRCH